MNVHTRPPGEPQDATLYIRTPVTPEEAFQAIGRLRKEARDEIDRLIRFLDDTDNHMELEEAVDDVPCDTDELEAGWTGLTANAGNMPNQDWLDEAEADGAGGDANDEESDHPEDGGDTEPSLIGVTANGHMTDNDLEADVMDSQTGSTPTKWLQAAQARRSSGARSNVRWPEGRLARSDDFATMPSNVVVIT